MPAESGYEENPSLRRRKASESTCENNENSNFSEDQIEAVEKIRNCRDFYKILGVEREAGESELRKQYKRLALQFHPDKNKAPGAVEAFKAIGNAFSVLSDPVKRKRYDEYGLESVHTAQSPDASEGNFGYYSFEGDMTAEEIYNMFFHGPTYVRRPRFHRQQPNHSDPYRDYDGRSTLMQLLPIAFVLCVSLLSSWFVADPAYSLHRTVKYVHERRTYKLDVPYYVQDGFPDEKIKDDVENLERHIENEYISIIRTSCFRERNYKENMIWRAKQFRDPNLEEKAQGLKTPSCSTLQELYKILQET